MHSQITPSAARELGRKLRFVRQARSLTLRDVSQRSGLSMQYLAQIETAKKIGVTEDAYERFGHALGLDPGIIGDLVLEARIQSALEARGLDAEQRAFVWRGIEQRLAEVGYDINTDISDVVVDILRGSPRGDEPAQGSAEERRGRRGH